MMDYRFEQSSFRSDNLLYVKVVLVSSAHDWNCSFVASSTAFISVSLKDNPRSFFWSDPCSVGDAIWCLGGRLPNSPDTQQILVQGTPRTFCANGSDVITGKFAYLSSRSSMCSDAITLDIQLSPRATFIVQCNSSVTANTQNSLTNVCDNLSFDMELYDRALVSLTSPSLATSTSQPLKMSAAQLVTNYMPDNSSSSYPVDERPTNKVLALACGVGIGVGAFVIVIVVYVIVIVIRRKRSNSEKSECFVESTMASNTSTMTSNSTFDKFSDQSTVVSEDIYFARPGLTSGVILKTGPTTGDDKKERNTYENVKPPAIKPPPEPMSPVSQEQLPAAKTRRPTTLTRRLYSMIASKAAEDPDYLRVDPGNSDRMSVNHDPGVNQSEGDIADAWLYGSNQSDLAIDMAV